VHFFEYARDYYNGWLPVRLLAPAGLLFIWTVALFAGIHLLRRSAGQPVSTESGLQERIAAGRIEKYQRNARLYHWGNALFLLALVISGVALFVPGALKPLRISWLRLHEFAAGAFVVTLLLHIMAAPRKGRWRTMWFERRDWRDMRRIAANFFGRTREYPAFGKYDPFQKLYHASLTLLSAGMIFSGVFLVVSAEVWASFSHPWLRWQRLLHDVGAFAFIAVMVGHIYFGIIRVNWPNLLAMIQGWIPASFFNRYHTTARWRPTVDDSPGEDDRG